MSCEISARVRGNVEAAERISSGAVTVHYAGSAVDLGGQPMLSRRTVPVIPERFDELIEAARLLPRLSDAVEAVVELHRPVRDYGGTACAECEQPYPCLTVEEVKATLEGDKR